jgi:hypothetical protein
MDQTVRWKDGSLLTPREAIVKGLARVERVADFKGSTKGPVRSATFVTHNDGSCVEVSGFVRCG